MGDPHGPLIDLPVITLLRNEQSLGSGRIAQITHKMFGCEFQGECHGR